MSVTAVSAIASYSRDPLRQQNDLRQDLLVLQRALSLGYLPSAQQALSHFQQDLESLRPQQNGVRASAEANLASTMRSDLQALQSALDSGDLAMAEESLSCGCNRIAHQIAGRAASDPQTSETSGALPKDANDGTDGLTLTGAESKGSLIDLKA